MDYLTENVAVNLKRIRQSKGMSLDQASEQTGVSKSMLSQIEKGTANPSLGVLGKITSGLRIEFQELIATPLVDSYLVTPEDLVPKNSLEIMKLLEEINERGTSVLVVTHNREIVNSFRKRVITMRKGVIVSDEEEGGYLED